MISDDTRKTNDMEKIIVSVLNQTGGANYRGKCKRSCYPIMTSNWTPERRRH